jgi:glycosyltransferase involved in cell wall biosynthesis
MKTAVIALYASYPPTCGAAMASYQTARNWPGEVRLFQMTDRPGAASASPRDRLSVVDLPLRSRTRLGKAVRFIGWLRGFTRAVRSWNPNVVLFEGSSWAFYYWVLFDRLRRIRPRPRFVYHGHNVEYLLRRQKHGRIVAGLTRWAEGRLLRAVDVPTAVSDIDARQFGELYGVSPWVFPNGVDVSGFGEVGPIEVSGIKKKFGLAGKNCLFMGLLNYLPNAEGLDFLLRIFPQIRAVDPEAHLALIGGSLRFEADWLVNPGLIPFEDVPAFIKACDVGLAPVFSGSGTRLKILEYMAAGKPVVATSKAAEGLEVENGRNIVIADDARTFVRETLGLLKDRDRAEAVGRAGRELVEERYAWDALVRRLAGRVEDLAAGKK